MPLISLDCRRSPDWLKMKNPACAAVKREAEDEARPSQTSVSLNCGPGLEETGRGPCLVPPVPEAIDPTET